MGEVERDRIQYWCVSDNLLKGAATNAVQIAESLVGARVWRIFEGAPAGGAVG